MIPLLWVSPRLPVEDIKHGSFADAVPECDEADRRPEAGGFRAANLDDLAHVNPRQLCVSM
jgi:hypothetical protein